MAFPLKRTATNKYFYHCEKAVFPKKPKNLWQVTSSVESGFIQPLFYGAGVRAEFSRALAGFDAERSLTISLRVTSGDELECPKLKHLEPVSGASLTKRTRLHHHDSSHIHMNHCKRASKFTVSSNKNTQRARGGSWRETVKKKSPSLLLMHSTSRQKFLTFWSCAEAAAIHQSGHRGLKKIGGVRGRPLHVWEEEQNRDKRQPRTGTEHENELHFPDITFRTFSTRWTCLHSITLVLILLFGGNGRGVHADFESWLAFSLALKWELLLSHRHKETDLHLEKFYSFISIPPSPHFKISLDVYSRHKVVLLLVEQKVTSGRRGVMRL